jgi:hypothetical protein
VRDVQVVEQGAPGRVVVQDGVRQPRERGAIKLGDDRAGQRAGCGEARGPLVEQEGGDVAVEERVGERAAVVAPPAVGVQGGDGRRVPLPGLPESQLAWSGHGQFLLIGRATCSGIG